MYKYGPAFISNYVWRTTHRTVGGKFRSVADRLY
jgi:hypothetical protein